MHELDALRAVAEGIELSEVVEDTARVVTARGMMRGRPVVVRFLVDPDRDPKGLVRLAASLSERGPLDEPGLVPVLAANPEVEPPYLVEAPVAGEPLDRLLARGAAVDPVRLAGEVAGALSALMARGLVHGALAPDALVIEPDGSARLGGLAQVRMALDESDPARLEREGYLPPEELAGRRPDGPGDVYALALVVCEVAAGRPLFAPGAPRRIAPGARLAGWTPDPALQQRLGPLAPTIVSCLALNPEQRPLPSSIASQANRSDTAPGSLMLRSQPTEMSIELTPVAGVTARSAARAAPDTGPFPRPFGEYELLGELARGGMGVVYRARQHHPPRPVAIKVIMPGQDLAPRSVNRFLTEAKAAGQLDHPAIVPLYQLGEHEGQLFFSMPLLEGGSLHELCRQQPVAERRAAELVSAVAAAVHHAHQHGIIHRDLKPANILLDASGQPRVADFGLAKIEEEEGAEPTTACVVLGTPSYMAPEQATTGRGSVNRAVDIYALGAVLYFLLTGRPPFWAASATETVRQVIYEEPVPLRRLNADLSRDMETICLKCLQKEPERRYASAQALAEDLGRWLEGRPILARPVGTLERAVRWCRREPLAAGLGGAFLASLVVGSGVSTHLALRARAGERAALESADRAETSYRMARAALEKCMKLKDDPLLKRGEGQRLQIQLGTAEKEFYEQFVTLHGGRPEFDQERAAALVELARACQTLGAAGESIAHFEEAVALRQSLINRAPDDRAARLAWASTEGELAWTYMRKGRYPDAEHAFERAIDALTRWRASSPAAEAGPYALELAKALRNRCEVYVLENRREDAERSVRAALAALEPLRADDPQGLSTLAAIQSSLCRMLFAAERNAEALDLARASVASLERLVALQPDNSDHQNNLSIALDQVASLQVRLKQIDAAVPIAGRAAALAEKLVESHPARTDYRRQLVGSLSLRAYLLETQGHGDEARALSIRVTQLMAQLPSGAEFGPAQE